MPTLPTPRVAAVDYGSRRVGVAISDGLRLFARPVGTFPPDAAVEALRKLHAQHALGVIVVGWPLTEEGEEGEATARVQPYFNRLRNAFPGVEMVKLDERYTSEEAKSALHAAGKWKSVRRDKGLIDAAAACVLLQDYLDGR